MHKNSANELISQIVIASNVEEEVESIKAGLNQALHVVLYHEEMLLEHVKAVVKAAYIAESETKYIIIGSLKLNQYVQNALLKLLEEPPPHIRFIMVVPSKSILLPTVLSRLPLFRCKEEQTAVTGFDFSFKNFDLASLNQMLKSYERSPKREAKAVLEQLFLKATQEYKSLSLEQMEAFEQGFKLLELNGRFTSILLYVLLQFLPQGVKS